MSGHLPRFVPADDPATYTRGGLVLAVAYAPQVTITCQACKHTQLRLKLLTNSAISKATSDRLLTTHLDTLGWTRLRDGGADICPECAATRVEVCEFCRDYTGGHTSLCPTQLPGATP